MTKKKFRVDRFTWSGKDIEITKEKGLFQCQLCHKNFEDEFNLNVKSFTLQCPHCEGNNQASSNDTKAWIIGE
jgi:Zn finger protein HypA/HybF involved in hydrogenase expression